MKYTAFTFLRTSNYSKAKKWRTAVLNVHGSKCVLCGSYKLVECHHVEEKSSNPELQYEVDNGICLCYECHSKKHEYIEKYKSQRERRSNKIPEG